MTENINNNLFTVCQFAKKHNAFTEAALRYLIFNAKPRKSSTNQIIRNNGLEEHGVILRIGRKVLIHEYRFFEWLDSQQNAVDVNRKGYETLPSSQEGA